MADFINNVAAEDQYADALTLGPDFTCNEAIITVANNAALMQFAVGEIGNWAWTTEREYLSIPQSFAVGNVIGVRFRNAAAGQTARILATLSGPSDVHFAAGVPFTGTLSASGSLGGEVITGIVNADGTIAAGTGFTVNRPAQYVITFDTPFATAPIVQAFPTTNAENKFLYAQNVTGAGFEIVCLDNSGTIQYLPFNFTAQAVT